jgi:hypothetical protein
MWDLCMQWITFHHRLVQSLKSFKEVNDCA